jgi:hypothetical protein
MSDTVSNEVKLFKEVADGLFSEQGGDNKKTRDEIICMMLDTEYGHLVSDSTLEEVAYIYGITRERVRQLQDNAIGKRNSVGKLVRKGKIHSTKFSKTNELREYIKC